MDYFFEYVDYIAKTGKPISNAVRQALDRVPLYLMRFHYRKEYPEALVHFIESFIYLQKGGGSAKPMKLQPEQKFWLSLFGLVDDKGHQVVNDIALVLGAGSGKSTFVAALSLAVMMVGSETGNDVLVMSNSQEQSQETFRTASEMVRDDRSVLGELTRRHVIKPVIKKIKYEPTRSQISVKAMDNKTADGVNVRMAIFDEMHSYRENVIENIRKSSAPKRVKTGFTTVYITTNGQVRGSVFDNYLKYWRQVLEGTVEDWSTFPMIYELDSVAELQDPETYPKAMPFINEISDISVPVNQLKQARNDPVRLAELLAKSFNIPQTEFNAVFHNDELTKDMEAKPVGELSSVVYVGFDLSAVNDLSAVAFLRFDEEGTPVYDVKAWIPSETYRSRISPEQRQNYDRFKAAGTLKLIEGNIIDEREVFDEVAEYISRNRLTVAGFSGDGFYSRNFQRYIRETYGADSLKVTRQTVGNFSDPLKHLITLFQAGTTPINSDLMAWSLSNVRVRIDANDNIYPNKSKAAEKIDPVLAMLHAFIVYQDEQAQPKWRGW